MKLPSGKLYIFHQKWWVFIFQAYGEKKKIKKYQPKFLAFYDRSQRANKTFFLGLMQRVAWQIPPKDQTNKEITNFCPFFVLFSFSYKKNYSNNTHTKRYNKSYDL